MKAIVVRDAIHGYIRIAAHERIVVDHPMTQRLRYVSQTGLAHLIYPEARTARFVHSLGAMHLASRFLVSAIEGAATATAKEFIDELEKDFADTKKSLEDGLSDAPAVEDFELLFDETGNLSGHGLLAATTRWKGADATRARHLLAYAEAGLRLAALFHDLGHMPMSHDFELALNDFASLLNNRPPELEKLIKGAAHENVGHKLAPLVLKELVNKSQQFKEDKKRAAVARAVYRLAWKILDHEPEYRERRVAKTGVLEWLHSLVDGDLDVDRADYLLRDGRALAFDFATYDLERLVDNVVLARHPEMGFVTAVDERGLAALESFFLARFRSNQWLVRHHKVAQVGQAFQHASAHALLEGQGDQLLKCLFAIMADEADETTLREFARFDDVWWLEQLRRWNGGKQPTPLVRASLDLILQRQASFKSLWKRQGQVDETTRKRFNAAEKKVWGGGKWNSLRQELQKRNVLLARYSFTAVHVRPSLEEKGQQKDEGADDHKESVVQVVIGGGLQPASVMSPPIESLRTWFEDECHVHAFAVSSTVEPDGMKERAAEVLKVLEDTAA